MDKKKYFRDLPIEFRLQFVKDVLLEFYPFSKDDLDNYQHKLDFHLLSVNQFIDWNVELVNKYMDKWDWIAIENNPIICKEVNLGFLYPDKVNIPKPLCNCSKMVGFCNEKKHCTGFYDEAKLSLKKNNSINPKLVGFIRFLFEDNPFGPFLMNCVFQYDILIDSFDDYEIDSDEEAEVKDNKDVPF